MSIKYILIFFILVIFCLTVIVPLFSISQIKKKHNNMTQLSKKLLKFKKENTEIFVREENSIQKNIVQTYKNIDLVPAEVISKIKDNNPGWDYYFYNDEECEKFLTDNFNPEIIIKYKSFKDGAHRADLFRLCWLYINGGVYMDIDLNLFESLDNVISKISSNFTMPYTTEESYGIKINRLLNAFIISNKGNPLVKDCIINILNIEPKDLDKNYCLILYVMEYTLRNKIKYDFVEKDFSTIKPYVHDWFILDKEGKKIAKSKYENYDQKKGFLI